MRSEGTANRRQDGKLSPPRVPLPRFLQGTKQQNKVTHTHGRARAQKCYLCLLVPYMPGHTRLYEDNNTNPRHYIYYRRTA